MDKEGIKAKLKKLLPRERFEHSLRVLNCALDLARRYNCDEEKASVAALLHDCGRYAEGRKLLSEAKKYKIKIGAIERIEPKLLHAELGKKIARKVFDVKDSDILNAIKKHTLGSEKMSLLDKIVFVADHAESGRRYKKVNFVRSAANKSLDLAIVLSTSSMIDSLNKEKLPISEQTVKTRNYYIIYGR